MSDFKSVVELIESNRENVYNCIPIGFNRLEPYYAGIEKGSYTIITASSGISKSKFTKHYFMFKPIGFVKNNPESELSVKIHFFSLEETKQKFILNFISYYLFKKYNIRLDLKDLLSIRKTRHITQEILDKIYEAESYFADLEEYIVIHEDTRNPFGMYSKIRSEMEQNGSFYHKGQRVTRTGSWTDFHWDEYKENDKKHYTIVITDHVKLMTKEQGDLSIRDTIGKWSSQYCIGLRNKMNCSIINVQQQAADVEADTYNMKGNMIEAKLEPSLDSLGENRTTQFDADYVLGLFAPNRYGITKHGSEKQYDISILRDNYRNLSILKSRDGNSHVKIGMYFDGATGDFKELPKIMTQQDYEKIKNGTF